MRILTVNGGGSLGLIPAVFIREMEAATGKQAYQLFDMICGVSTGSIIAAGLAHGIPAKDLVDKYKEFVPAIFGKPNPFWKIWSAKYDASILQKYCQEILGYPINDAKTRLMFNAVEISGSIIQPWFFKSWEDTLPTYMAVVGSCSAPTYFEPHVLGPYVFIDGGISTNNISMCAVAEAAKLGNELKDISVINLACCKSKGYKNARSMKGVIQWIAQIAGTFLSASDPLATYQVDQLLDKHIFDADGDCATRFREDGISCVKIMESS